MIEHHPTTWRNAQRVRAPIRAVPLRAAAAADAAARNAVLNMLAGSATGLVLAWLLDRAIGGPGLAVMIGG